MQAGSNQWVPLMDRENNGLARYPSADRIGFARLTTMAFEGQPGAVLVELDPATGVSFQSIDLAASRENVAG